MKHFLNLGVAGALALAFSAPAHGAIFVGLGAPIESLIGADFASQPPLTANTTYTSPSGVHVAYIGATSGISSTVVPGNGWAPRGTGLSPPFATGYTSITMADGSYFNALSADFGQNMNSMLATFPIDLDFQVIDNHGDVVLDGSLPGLHYRSYQTFVFTATGFDTIAKINVRATFASNPAGFMPSSGFQGEALLLDNVKIFPRLQDDLDPPIIITPPGGVAVPEPATWAMMILGFGLAGSVLRRRHRAIA